MMRVTLRYLFVIAICSVLAACGGSGGVPSSSVTSAGGYALAPGQNDPTVLQYLSPQLSPAEQQVMYPILADITPESAREDVTYIDGNGTIHANRPEFAQENDVYFLTSTPNVYADASGDTILGTMASTQSSPSWCTQQDGCSGVAHIVTSPPGNQYFAGSVRVGCNDSRLLQPENGFAYTGGATPRKNRVDAGIQINANNGGGPAVPTAPQSIQAFIAWGKMYARKHIDLGCGDQTVALTFNIEHTAGHVRLTVNGGHAIVFAVPDGRGGVDKDFSQECLCTVKRVTTIAVPFFTDPTSQKAMLSTYLQVKDPFSDNPAPLIAWSSATVGHYEGGGQPVTSRWRDYEVQDIEPPGNAAILVNKIDNANETVGIDLSMLPIVLNDKQRSPR